MNAEDRSAEPRPWAWMMLSVVMVVALDQVSKALVINSIAMGEREEVLPFLDLVHIENEGVAFGFLGGSGRGVVLAVTLAALVLVVAWFAFNRVRPFAWLAIGLLAGGAIGNLIDRALEGSVTDFVKLPHFPAFNVADTAITFGVLALLYVLEGPPRRRAEAARDG